MKRTLERCFAHLCEFFLGTNYCFVLPLRVAQSRSSQFGHLTPSFLKSRIWDKVVKVSSINKKNCCLSPAQSALVPRQWLTHYAVNMSREFEDHLTLQKKNEDQVATKESAFRDKYTNTNVVVLHKHSAESVHHDSGSEKKKESKSLFTLAPSNIWLYLNKHDSFSKMFMRKI